MLPAQGEAAREILALAGNHCSAKEVIIAIQEAVERIQNYFSDEDDDEDSGLSLVGQLDTLVSLYSSCKPQPQLEIVMYYQLCYSHYSIEAAK